MHTCIKEKREDTSLTVGKGYNKKVGLDGRRKELGL